MAMVYSVPYTNHWLAAYHLKCNLMDQKPTILYFSTVLIQSKYSGYQYKTI
jgi:hypothetical protein